MEQTQPSAAGEADRDEPVGEVSPVTGAGDGVGVDGAVAAQGGAVDGAVAADGVGVDRAVAAEGDDDGAVAAQGAGSRRLTALIVDWGGVLTNPLDTAMTTWAEADGVDFAHFADVMRDWVGSTGSGPVASGGAGGPDGDGGATADVTAQHVERSGGAGGPDGDGGATADVTAQHVERSGGADRRGVADDAGADPLVLSELEDAARLGLVPGSPVHALERGEISVQQFEQRLAAALKERGSAVEADGLLGRVLGGLADLRDDMLGLVRRARHSGLRTALLSNSWGDESYPEAEWEGAFDVVVISGRVGMRKPDAEIFLHTANLLGVPPEECVMVDDLAGNIRGAVDAGMVGVLHKTYEETAEELEILFDRTLR